MATSSHLGGTILENVVSTLSSSRKQLDKMSSLSHVGGIMVARCCRFSKIASHNGTFVLLSGRNSGVLMPMRSCDVNLCLGRTSTRSFSAIKHSSEGVKVSDKFEAIGECA